MNFLLPGISMSGRAWESTYPLTALQRAYGCRCHSAVFFLNSHCLRCDTPLGYEPELGQVLSLEPGPGAGTWQLAGPNIPAGNSQVYRRCANLNTPAACNWLILADASTNAYCTACRLNRTVPIFRRLKMRSSGGALRLQNGA